MGESSVAQRARIVIAEDEAIIRLDLKESLVDAGYDVIGETGRGDEALTLVADLQPDLVLLDIKMPGMDGIEAAREISRDRGAAVVILTAFSQRELVERAVEAGALAYLVKPFQRAELMAAVEIAVARHREVKALSSQAEALEDKLETRKTIDRAKGALMDALGVGESDAFSYLQKRAMHDRRTMKDLAEEILRDGPPTSLDAG